MEGKCQRHSATTYAEILRGSLKKNAIRIDGDSGFAKKEPHCGDGNDPPAIEDATAREKQLVSFAAYRNDSDDPAFCLRGRVAYPGVIQIRFLAIPFEKTVRIAQAGLADAFAPGT